MSLILAIDIGTSRVKVATVNLHGHITALYDKQIPRRENTDCQDAEIWWQFCVDLIKRVESKEEIEAVALTGNMHALLAIDHRGDLLEHARLWSDISAQQESDYLNATYGDKLLQLFGNRSIPGFTLPKLMKMKQERRNLFEKINTLLQPKDFINFRLTGSKVTDPVDAASTFMMNYETGGWADDFIRELGIDPGILPEIKAPAEVCGYINEESSRLTGLKAGLPVVTGAGDLATALLGSGGDEQTYSLTLGTAGQLMKVTNIVPDEVKGKVFVFPYVEEGRSLLLGSIPAGGLSFEWLAHRFNLTLPEFFEKASSDGLSDNPAIYLPYILGSGSPIMDYSASGAFLRMSAKHSTGNLCASAIAGVVSSLKHSMDVMHVDDNSENSLVVQALAVRQSTVRETVRQIFKSDLYTVEESEASIVGAAILGAVGAGFYESIEAASGKMLRKKLLCRKSAEHTHEEYQNYYLSYRSFSLF